MWDNFCDGQCFVEKMSHCNETLAAENYLLEIQAISSSRVLLYVFLSDEGHCWRQ